MGLTMQEKTKSIQFFEFLLDEEISKPLGEMNDRAVDNYLEILLHLHDIHIELSPQFIDEQVRKIFHGEDMTATPKTAETNKKRYNKKVWLVAACISILVALFSIVSFSSERSVVDVLEDFLGTYEFIPFGKNIEVGNETYGKSSESRYYESIDEFIKNEKIKLLYPKNYSDNITHISVTELNGKGTITFTFKDNTFIQITLNKELTKEIPTVYDEIVTLNGLDCYICLMDDVSQAQAYFTYNNNLYFVSHTDKNSLMDVLNNMEEIKYED